MGSLEHEYCKSLIKHKQCKSLYTNTNNAVDVINDIIIHSAKWMWVKREHASKHTSEGFKCKVFMCVCVCICMCSNTQNGGGGGGKVGPKSFRALKWYNTHYYLHAHAWLMRWYVQLDASTGRIILQRGGGGGALRKPNIASLDWINTQQCEYMWERINSIRFLPIRAWEARFYDV